MFEAFSLSSLCTPLAAQHWGDDVRFSSVSTDSRGIQPGQLFVALSGERFDGHDYLAEVAAKGAAAALVSRHIPGLPLPQLCVADTRLALGQLAALNRQRFQGRMAAVTGSSGKTTVKELIASILRADQGEAAVLATKGNLNNDLGVPLTLLELNAQHQSAIVELGASRLGEIAYTVSLVQPQVCLINNAGLAHVGEFGGPDKIVEAKGEILDGLTAQGTTVLNRDDPAFPIWHTRAGQRRVLSFSLDHPLADFRAKAITQRADGCPSFQLETPYGSAPVQLSLLGRHNVANALAAAAVAYALGISLEAIQRGLQSVQPVKGRAVTSQGLQGVRLIDDSYNANPASICAATDILSGLAGRRLLVLGDIGELGEWAEAGHRQVGTYARGKVDALYAVGHHMAHAVAAFGPQGQHFPDQAALIDALRVQCAPDTTFLIKGSRSAAMDKVVAALSPSTTETH